MQRILSCTYKLLRADPLNELLRQQPPLKVSNRRYPLHSTTAWANPKSPVLRIRIRDQGSGAFFTPEFGIWDTGSGSGMGEKSGSESGIRIRDGKPRSYFWELRNHLFLVKILKFFDVDPGSRIQDPGWKKLGSRIRDPGWKIFGSRIWDLGWKKFRSGIWVKHPGSAKLEISSPNLPGLEDPSNNQTQSHFGMRPRHFYNLRPHQWR